jgi:alkyl sulfatase BDS1-like metallo-beta-lactamase superfamily hydrolase
VRRVQRPARSLLAESGRLRVEGHGVKLGELLGLLDEPDPGFAIVTPRLSEADVNQLPANAPA